MPRPVDPTGRSGPTRRQAAGRRYRQTSAGLYVPASSPTHVDQRIFEQGHRVRSGGAVTGWASLRWWGAAFFDGCARGGEVDLPVPLVVGLHRLQADPRVVISQAQIAPTERVRVAGIWCTTIQRALFDEMRHASGLRQAVVAMDMAAAARLISVELMRRYVCQRNAWTGVPLVRRALALASNHSRSPQETAMRLVWVLDAGLPTPLSNVPVFDRSGRLLGVPDLFDPVAGLAGEYDGADHKGRERHRADVAREDDLRAHGMEYFTVVGGDLLDRGLVAARMLRARRRARFAPEAARQWTLTPPPWWTPWEEPLDTHLLRIGAAPMLVRT